MKKASFLSLVLVSSMTISSCFSVPFVNAETNTEQIKQLLESFIDQNYKGDAQINVGGIDGAVEVIFRDVAINEPAFNHEAIRSDFEKFLTEHNIALSDVIVAFLEDAPMVLDQGQIVADDLGDIDLNGTIDVTDLTELSLALIGDKELTAAGQKAADIDGDGSVTLADLARLQQYLSKKIDKL